MSYSDQNKNYSRDNQQQDQERSESLMGSYQFLKWKPYSYSNDFIDSEMEDLAKKVAINSQQKFQDKFIEQNPILSSPNEFEMDEITENDEKLLQTKLKDKGEISKEKVTSKLQQAEKPKNQKLIFKKRKALPTAAKKFIFSYYNIKKMTKKVSLQKFLVRLFLKYNKSLSFIPPLQQHNKKMTAKLMSHRKNDFCLSDIHSICAVDLDYMPEINILNRRLLWHIIRTYQSQQIIKNQCFQIDRKAYLIGAKVYSLRCRSKKLAQRLIFK